MDDIYLEHHGIKGMKWGVRRLRTQSKLGRKHKKIISREPFHDDYNNAHSKKNVKYMSNNELRSRINRLQMEQQYSELTSKDKKNGSKVVTDILRKSGKQAISNYTVRYMSKGIDILDASIKKQLMIKK